jgi:hypothetical protein
MPFTADGTFGSEDASVVKHVSEIMSNDQTT